MLPRSRCIVFVLKACNCYSASYLCSKTYTNLLLLITHFYLFFLSISYMCKPKQNMSYFFSLLRQKLPALTSALKKDFASN